MHIPDYEKDRALVQAASRCDPEAMRQIVERHQDRVYHLAYRLVGDADAARDVVQDTFLKAFENLGRMNNGGLLTQGLRQIAVNLIRDRWKTRQKTVCLNEGDPELPQSRHNPVRDFEIRQMGERIQAALMELPHTYRKMFLLKYVEEMSCVEISGLLGVSVPAAKVQAHRACKMLRRLLPEYDDVQRR
ncbi:MAG: RNA polymerase sigma factor [Candidatus Latescibacteria bacterium]|nr:RNA polymerase sigma factor [Candidatus Latescibacterota bacterium]